MINVNLFYVSETILVYFESLFCCKYHKNNFQYIIDPDKDEVPVKKSMKRYDLR